MKAEEASIIRTIPLFADLHADAIGFLANVLREVQFEAETLFLREGDPGDTFYIILDGQVEVVKAIETLDERDVATLGPGEFFGEMSLLEPEGQRTASVRAVSDVRLLEMDRADFDALLERWPAMACHMVRVLSVRLDRTHNATIADLRQKNRELAKAYLKLQTAQAQIIEKERLEQELETARWIQQRILPRALPHLPGFDFGGRLVTAQAVGGDLYDFINLDDGQVGVVIGDVSGKGVPAAIIMALTHSLLRAEAARTRSPAEALLSANRHLLDMTEVGMFVTVLYGVLDCRRRRFTYARAGHEYPLFFDSGQVRPIQHGTGQPLAIFCSPALDEQSLELPPGATLLLYTDGAADVADPQGVPFDYDRLEAAAQASLSDTAQGTCDGLWKALATHQGGATQFDDVALVAIHAAP